MLDLTGGGDARPHRNEPARPRRRGTRRRREGDLLLGGAGKVRRGSAGLVRRESGERSEVEKKKKQFRDKLIELTRGIELG